MSEIFFCPTCGYPVPERVRNCIRCGHPIDKGRPLGGISVPGDPPKEDETGGANLPDNNGKEDFQEKKRSGIMTNFFKKLFVKKKTETPLSVDSILNALPDNIAYLNKCICNVCLKGDDLSKHKTDIENYFPNEPKLYNNVAVLSAMLNHLADAPLLTGKALLDFKNKAKVAHIDGKIIDYIISEKKNTPPRESSVPQGKELDRYGLAFMLVPLLVESYNESLHNGGVSEGKEDIFWNIAFWRHIAGKMDFTRTDFDWNEILFFKQQIGQKKFVAITFPKPFKVPQAKYGLVVIDKEVSYYTLEKTGNLSNYSGSNDDGQDDYWVLGGVRGRDHLNFGTIKGDLTVSQFIEEVIKKL